MLLTFFKKLLIIFLIERTVRRKCERCYSHELNGKTLCTVSLFDDNQCFDCSCSSFKCSAIKCRPSDVQTKINNSIDSVESYYGVFGSKVNR